MEAIRQIACSDHIALARETSRFIGDALAVHPGRFVALAVGESTLPLYARLDELGAAWAGRAVMPVDELVPAPADPSRRFWARLGAALPEVLRSRLHPIEVDGDPGLRAIQLEARLRTEGLAAVVLGLGPDGHVAFNQPPTPADACTRLVRLAPANLARLGPVSPSHSALTLGMATIMSAGSVLVVVSGPGKNDALHHLRHGPEDPAWPVTWLRRHRRLTVALGPS